MLVPFQLLAHTTYLRVPQQRGLGGQRLGEVAHQRGLGQHASAVKLRVGDAQREASGVRVLPVAWKQVCRSATKR